MEISYGGLLFKVVKTIEFDRRPVMDDAGVDYLFTKVTGNVLALCNGQLFNNVPGPDGFPVLPDMGGMSYTQVPSSGGGVPQISYASGIPPIVTDATIRHWLSVPRRQLIVADSTGLRLINSPKNGRSTDAHNGPFCDVFSIQAVMGDARTFIVNFQFTTYVNECEEAENKLGVLLSNRFSQYHTLSQDYGLTVVTQGTAHFRTDLLYTSVLGFDVYSYNPDLLRPYLFLPIPYGFKRTVNYVRGRADGSGIDYEFSDTQQPVQYVAGDEIGATRIETSYRQAVISSKDALGTVLNSVEKAFNTRWLSKSQQKEAAEESAAAAAAKTKGAAKATAAAATATASKAKSVKPPTPPKGK